MKKKVLFILLIVVTGMFFGCGTPEQTIKPGENISTGDAETKNGETTAEKTTAVENPTEKVKEEQITQSYDSRDGLPPVEPEMKQFYQEAEELFKDVVFLRIKCDEQQSKMESSGDEDVNVLYYRVVDNRYPTLEKLKEELEQYFTKPFTEQLVSEPIWNQPRFREYDGQLYMIQASRGGNIQYAGHVFETVEADENTIKMPVKVYYALNATPYEYFYEYPEDLAAYEVKEYTQIMTREDGKWKFSQFELFY